MGEGGIYLLFPAILILFVVILYIWQPDLGENAPDSRREASVAFPWGGDVYYFTESEYTWRQKRRIVWTRYFPTAEAAEAAVRAEARRRDRPGEEFGIGWGVWATSFAPAEDRLPAPEVQP